MYPNSLQRGGTLLPLQQRLSEVAEMEGLSKIPALVTSTQDVQIAIESHLLHHEPERSQTVQRESVGDRTEMTDVRVLRK